MKKFLTVIIIIIMAALLGALFFLRSALSKGKNFGMKTLDSNTEVKTEEKKKEEPELKTTDVFKDNKPLNIIILGEDTTPTRDDPKGKYVGRTDTIMVATLDPERKKARLLSVPRDSRVKIPGHKVQKINAAYPLGGVQLTVDTLEEFLGIDIDHYVIVNYDMIRDLIDAVGGIEVYIPKDYKKRDDWVIPALVIDFKKGWHTLNGEDAVKYLRIRDIYPIPDIGRISAQQDFILTLFDKLKGPRTIFMLPKLLDIVTTNVKTDLTYGEMAYLGIWGLKLNREDISTATIEGHGQKMDDGIDYWIVDQEKAKAKYQEFFNEGQAPSTTTDELKVYRLGEDGDGTNPVHTREEIEKEAEERLKGIK